LDLSDRTDRFGDVSFTGSGNITNMNSVTLLGSVRVESGPSNAPVNLSGTLELPGFTSFNVNNTLIEPAIVLTGSIVGAGGISKNGPGMMRIVSAGSYLGPVVVSGGLLQAGSGSALGATGAGTTVLDGATLSSEIAVALAEPLTLNGAGRNGTNGALFLGPGTGVQSGIVLASDATVRNDVQFAILSGVVSGPGGLTKTGAGTLQLGGGSGAANTYTGDTFVEEGVLVPSKGTGVTTIPGHLIIGGGGGLLATAATVRHSAGFTIVGSITVNRGGLWDLNGFSESFDVTALQGRLALTLNNGGDVQTGAGTLALPAGDVMVNPGSTIGANSFISGNLVLQPGSHRFIVQNGITVIGLDDIPELDVPAVVSEQPLGAADIVKEGFGAMRLGGANSFTGPVTVNQGGLTAANAVALGTAAAGTFVNGNASLAVEGRIEIMEPLTLNSTNAAALISLGPVTNVWSGNIILQRTAGIRVSDPIGALTHFGGVGQFDNSAISGPGGFTKSGPGVLFITGFQGGNSYTGPTTVAEGMLEALRRSSLSDDILVIGTNATLRTGRATGLSPARTVLPIGTRMTVTDGALWSMNGTNIETLTRLVGDGRLNISTGGTLTLSNSVSCTFDGQVSGSGALNKRGLATFRCTGQSPSYTGPATVFDGTYKVDGDFAASPVTVKVSSILRGSGAVGDVTVENGGVVRVDPRNPGYLGGSMQFNSVNFQSGGVLGAQFFGPHPTGGNDSLEVLNGVTLNTPALSSGFQYPPHEGDVITLIQNVGAGAISGAFSGFPEGAVRTIGQIPVVTSYEGGDGNDMTLTVTNLPLVGAGSQLVTGNFGSALVPNDCSQLWLVVSNRGAVALTGLRGTLRSLTEGVVVTRAESAFPNLIPNARGSNATPFQVRTEPSFPCGGGAQFELVLTGSNIPPIAVFYTFPGNAGRALAFNGSGNYVAVPHTAALNAFPFTVTMWVKTRQSSAGLVTKYVSSSLNGWSVFLRSGRVHAWYFRDSANNVWGGGDGLDGGFVADGQWHHIAFTVNTGVLGNGGRLSVDGVLKDTQPWSSGRDPQPGPPTTTQEVRLGNESGTGIPFDGLLDEIAIWQNVLSQAQIQTNMHRGLTGAEANLLAYYRCDESSGFTVSDIAPLNGNNNGTWVGTPLFALSDVSLFSVPGGPDCNAGGGACESCLVVSGTFTTNTSTLLTPLSPESSASVCFPPKPCPGPFPFLLPPTPFIQHTFANTSGTQACVTAQLRFDCPAAAQSAMHAAAYLGVFDPDNPCLNYLGDGGGDGTAAFSFSVPASSNVVIVVTLWAPGIGCDAYTLELFGLPCPPPALVISPEAAPQKVRVHWSTAYPDFTAQQAGQVNGPFSNVSQSPALINGRYALTNIAAMTNRFYRLKK
jgi:autotransporter-associated beta strand protein